jgi:hypothetical protein
VRSVTGVVAGESWCARRIVQGTSTATRPAKQSGAGNKVATLAACCRPSPTPAGGGADAPPTRPLQSLDHLESTSKVPKYVPQPDAPIARPCQAGPLACAAAQIRLAAQREPEQVHCTRQAGWQPKACYSAAELCRDENNDGYIEMASVPRRAHLPELGRRTPSGLREPPTRCGGCAG